MIRTNKMTKIYNRKIHALRGINLTIKSKGLFGLLGVNGAGKTTLMRIFAGILEPSSGQISVFGHDMTTVKGRQATKSKLGYLPQEMGLYPNLTAREFLDYIGVLKGITSKYERERQIEEALERVHLLDVSDRQMKTFSGGMKRRVGIAQALLGHPKLVIVDEPTVGLDPEERIRMRILLGEIAQQAMVILSTHIVEDISHSCNDLAVLMDGQVVFRGSPAELISGAKGKVWHIKTHDDKRPSESLSLISTLQLASSVQYRVLGDNVEGYEAESVEPSLEDGYMWLMRCIRQERA